MLHNNIHDIIIVNTKYKLIDTGNSTPTTLHTSGPGVSSITQAVAASIRLRGGWRTLTSTCTSALATESREWALAWEVTEASSMASNSGAGIIKLKKES